MFQAVVFPPAQFLHDVEEFRRRHDPAFHRVAAHLPLVAPFDAADEGLVARLDAFRAAPFEVSFGPPAAHGEALLLPVVGGAAEFDALQRALALFLRGDVPDPPPLAALRAGLFGTTAELELARRALATLPPTPPFVVREVTLLMEDVRGLWHEVRRRRLAR